MVLGSCWKHLSNAAKNPSGSHEGPKVVVEETRAFEKQRTHLFHSAHGGRRFACQLNGMCMYLCFKNHQTSKALAFFGLGAAEQRVYCLLLQWIFGWEVIENQALDLLQLPVRPFPNSEKARLKLTQQIEIKCKTWHKSCCCEFALHVCCWASHSLSSSTGCRAIATKIETVRLVLPVSFTTCDGFPVWAGRTGHASHQENEATSTL